MFPPTCILLETGQETSAFCLLLFLFALLIVLHFIFFHLVPSTLHGLNSGVTRSALFIIVYLERTCFIRQAVLPWPIDCKAPVDWIVEWGDGKRREGETEKGRETLSYLQFQHGTQNVSSSCVWHVVLLWKIWIFDWMKPQNESCKLFSVLMCYDQVTSGGKCNKNGRKPDFSFLIWSNIMLLFVQRDPLLSFTAKCYCSHWTILNSNEYIH